MGVKNLWQLLAPIGRRINVESLEGKTLAVDVSIWLTQFIKAMRDDEGRIVKNAHIIGTLRRVVKLLFHRVRPVFVFDGGAPQLKERTLRARRKQKVHAELVARKAAQRLLAQQLKQQKRGTASSGAQRTSGGQASFNPMFQVDPPIKPATELEGGRAPAALGEAAAGGGFAERAEKDDRAGGLDAVSLNTTTGGSDTRGSSGPAVATQASVASATADAGDAAERTGSNGGNGSGPHRDSLGSGSSHGDSLSRSGAVRRRVLVGGPCTSDSYSDEDWDDGFEVPQNSAEIDVEAISSLPSDMRKSVIETVQRQQRVRSRQQYMPVAGDPALYSQAQIANFLRGSQLNRKIMEAASTHESESVGRRIASDSTRKYIIDHHSGGGDDGGRSGRVIRRRIADDSDDDGDQPGSIGAYASHGRAAAAAGTQPQTNSDEPSSRFPAITTFTVFETDCGPGMEKAGGEKAVNDTCDTGTRGVEAVPELSDAILLSPDAGTLVASGGVHETDGGFLPADRMEAEGESPPQQVVASSTHSPGGLGIARGPSANSRGSPLSSPRGIPNGGAGSVEIFSGGSDSSAFANKSKGKSKARSVPLPAVEEGFRLAKEVHAGAFAEAPQKVADNPALPTAEGTSSSSPSSQQGANREEPFENFVLTEAAAFGHGGVDLALQAAILAEVGTRDKRPVVIGQGGPRAIGAGMGSSTGEMVEVFESMPKIGRSENSDLGGGSAEPAGASKEPKRTGNRATHAAIVVDGMDLDIGAVVLDPAVAAILSAESDGDALAAAASPQAGSCCSDDDWEAGIEEPEAGAALSSGSEHRDANEEAYRNAVATASRMAQWAGRAVERAMREHHEAAAGNAEGLRKGRSNSGSSAGGANGSHGGGGRATPPGQRVPVTPCVDAEVAVGSSCGRPEPKAAMEVACLDAEPDVVFERRIASAPSGRAPAQQQHAELDDGSMLSKARLHPSKLAEESLGKAPDGVRSASPSAKSVAATAQTGGADDPVPVATPPRIQAPRFSRLCSAGLAAATGTVNARRSPASLPAGSPFSSLNNALRSRQGLDREDDPQSGADTAGEQLLAICDPASAPATSNATTKSDTGPEPLAWEDLDSDLVTNSGAAAAAEDEEGGGADSDLGEEELRKQIRRGQRDAETVTEEMREEVMELLQVLGVPYIIAPMEAEAQCVELERLGLVDGTISDDSDLWVFGGRSVYKNIFDDKKYVEAYLLTDAQREMGIGTDEMQALALLLGSDYTEGVKGIGVVNAMEVVRAFPPAGKGPAHGLKQFKEWLDGFDVKTDAALVKRAKTGDAAALGGLTETQRFHIRHRGARNRWIVDATFPSEEVIKAYRHPRVDSSTEHFSWGVPDAKAFVRICEHILGWRKDEAEKMLSPIMQRLKQSPSKQTRLDSYFLAYHHNARPAKIRSKRLQAAVSGLVGKDVKELCVGELPSVVQPSLL